MGDAMIEKQEGYKVMSFNILGWIHGSAEENRADRENRLDLILDMVRKEKPDSIGFQEVSDRWLYLLAPRLLDCGYIWVGERNEDYNRWYNPIFYRRARLECVDAGTRWLSDTPEVAFSNYSATDQSRMVTYAVLKDRATNAVYTHFNTHLGIDRSAMRRQVEVLRGMTEESTYPFIITGDFNINEDWAEYQTVCSYWRDARYCAPITSKALTATGATMDYCMLSNSLVAKEFHVLDHPYVLMRDWLDGKTNGQPFYISDHYPIYTIFRLYS
jgi:endonuclease/exonuclease/phosphatase family metal-dependent hydrolase